MVVLVYNGGVATDRLQLPHGAVALPRLAVNFLMAAPFPAPWRPQGSRSTSSWRCLCKRGGMPTVGGQPPHGGTFYRGVIVICCHGSRSAPSFYILELLCRGGIPVVFFVARGGVVFRRWYSDSSRSTMCAVLFLRCDTPRVGAI